MPPLAYFIRHGQTDWNAEGRFQGQADTPINATGRLQAEKNGRLLAGQKQDFDGFDFVASPLQRTVETMRILRAAMGLEPEGFRTDPRLMELHFGEWQGSTLAEIERRMPGAGAVRDQDKWNFLPGGEAAESYEMLSRRIAGWLKEIDRPMVCVTHGGVIRALFRTIAGASEAEASSMLVPQDRVLAMRGSMLEWLE